MELQGIDILLSTLRWILGLSIGSAAAIIVAVCMRLMFRQHGVAVIWPIDFLRSLPLFGLVPLVQYHFSIQEPGKLLLICWAVFFPVFFAVDRALNEVVVDDDLFFRAMKASRWLRLRLDWTPRIRRGAVFGIQVGIGLAWITVVAAESIGTPNYGFWAGGLGTNLWRAFETNQVQLGIEDLFVFGALGALSSWLWRRATRALT